jgi:hypothetical protein
MGFIHGFQMLKPLGTSPIFALGTKYRPYIPTEDHQAAGVRVHTATLNDRVFLFHLSRIPPTACLFVVHHHRSESSFLHYLVIAGFAFAFVTPATSTLIPRPDHQTLHRYCSRVQPILGTSCGRKFGDAAMEGLKLLAEALLAGISKI